MNRLCIAVSFLLLFLGACAPGATPTSTPTATPMPTATSMVAPTATNIPTPEPTSTPTATPVPAYVLSSTVFFDYSGNGLPDEGEPPVEGVSIQPATNTKGPLPLRWRARQGPQRAWDVCFGLFGINPEELHELGRAWRFCSVTLCAQEGEG